MESKNRGISTNSYHFRILCIYCKRELHIANKNPRNYHKKCKKWVLEYNKKIGFQNNLQSLRPLNLSLKTFVKECAEVLSLIIDH